MITESERNKYDQIEDDKITGEQKIQFIGPFYTGFLLDTINLVSSGYQSQQLKIKTFMMNTGHKASMDWGIEGFIEDGDDSFELWSLDDLSGTPIVPNSFLVKKFRISNETYKMDGHSYSFEDSLLYIHDYGTGTFTINVHLHLQDELTYHEYLELSKKISDNFASKLNPIIEENVDFLKNCLDENDIAIIPLDTFHKKFKGLMKKLNPFKSVLWKHVVLYLDIKHKIPKMRTKEYDDFIHKYHTFIFSSQENVVNKSLDPNVFAYPGMLFSLILYSPNSKSIHYSRPVELAEYIYAAVALLDNIQFITLTEFASVKETDLNIKKLEESINDLSQINDRLDYFFIVLDNLTVTFSPQTTKIYENLKIEWYMDRLIDDLKRKEKDLEEELDSYLEYLTEKRQASLNRLVKIFTVFAILGPVFEIYIVLDEKGIDIFRLDPIFYIASFLLILFLSPILIILGLFFYRRF